MNLVEVGEAIAALGRPAPEFARWRQPGGPLRAIHEWEAAHPALAAKYQELFALREQLESSENLARLEEKNRASADLKLSRLGLDRAGFAAAAPEETDQIKNARDWFSGDKSWLILAGAVGNGKTVAAAWVLRQAALRGLSVGFVRSSDLAQKQINGEIQKLERVTYLAVDDVGVEHASGFAQSIMGQLCDARHQRIDVRTVITTNLTLAELTQRVGERVMDRWRESSVMKRTVGASMRLRTGP